MSNAGNKNEYFYMRLSKDQKERLKMAAQKKHMGMSQYIWHLMIKDLENENE
jgi:uncharacterized protein (DUF1778 family)